MRKSVKLNIHTISHVTAHIQQSLLDVNSHDCQLLVWWDDVGALTLLVGRQYEHLACKKTEWWGAGVVICVQRDANDMHMIQLMPLPPHHLLLYYNPDWFNVSGAGLPRLSCKRGHIKQVSVCVRVWQGHLRCTDRRSGAPSAESECGFHWWSTAAFSRDDGETTRPPSTCHHQCQQQVSKSTSVNVQHTTSTSSANLTDFFYYHRVDNHTVIDFIKETHFYHQL